MSAILEKMLQKKKLVYFLTGIFICTLAFNFTTVEGHAYISIQDMKFTEGGKTYLKVDDNIIQNPQEGIQYTYNSRSKTYSVTGFWGDDSGKEQNVKIPDTLRGKKITSIGENAFAYSSVKSVELGKYTTEIGKNAFVASSLTSITLPDSLKKIGNLAFAQTRLKSIKIPANVSSIGTYAFYKSDSLERITISKGKLKTLQEGFASETAIKEISIPSNITKLGAGAFENCKKLEKIAMKGKIKTIPNECFAKCSALKSFSIPKTVTKIERGAYSGCKSLKSVVIPKNVRALENEAFRDCKGLKKVDIKSSLKVLDFYTFYGCKALETVSLSNVGKVKYGAFTGCKSLYRVSVSSKVKDLDDGAFDTAVRKRLTVVTSKNSPVYKKYYENKELLVTSSKSFGFTQHTTLMVAGEKKQISALNYARQLKWKSSNSSVVRITSGGEATAVGAGNVTLTAASSTQKFTLRIRVLPRTVDNIMRVITREYVRPEMSDYEKVVETNAWLVKNIEYDHDDYLTNTIPWESYTADGTLQNGVGVCQGYALAFKKIMDYYQIPCMFVPSFPMNHAWNAVQIGGSWYHVDSTWNDPIVNGSAKNTHVGTSYLLASDSEIEDHYGYSNISCVTPNAQVNRYSRTPSANSNQVINDSPLNPYLNTTIVTVTKGGRAFNLKLTGTRAKSFSAKNRRIVSVTSKGAIKGKKRGTTMVTAKGADGKKYTCLVRVEAPKISKTRVTLNKDAGTRLMVSGTTKPVTWKSSNSKIATVTEKGQVKAVKRGTVKITATVDGVKLTCRVKVHEHSYKVKVTEATCTKEGKKVYTCSCGRTYTKKLKALGHNYKWVVTKQPSAYKALSEADFGIRELKCSRCSDVMAKETIVNIGGNKLIYGNFSDTKANALFKGINGQRAASVLELDEIGDAYFLEIPQLKHDTKMDFAAKMQAVMYAANEDNSAIAAYPGAVQITYDGTVTADSVAQRMGYDDNRKLANVLNPNMTHAGVAYFSRDVEIRGDDYVQECWVILER